MKAKTVKLAVPVSEVDWQVQDDYRTICHAREIERDVKRMAKVKEYAKKVMLDAGSIATSGEE